MRVTFLQAAHLVGAAGAYLSTLALVEGKPDSGPDAEHGLRIAIVVPEADVEIGKMVAHERLLLPHRTKSSPARCRE